MPGAPEETAAAKLAALAQSHLASFDVVVLAVSGGADSLSLIELVRDWRDHPGSALRDGTLPDIHVATVDHGVRAGAAAEIELVARAAGEAGLAHHVLHWDGSARSSGFQEAARTARYALLADLAARLAAARGPECAAAVVTGHHADDQAETLLMRLARGSGLDGLAAMPAERMLAVIEGHRIALVRPFIGIAKSQLVGLLRERGRSWAEDPSNENDAYERVRLRQAAKALAAAGVESTAVARSAARLQRSREALEAIVRQTIRDGVDLQGGVQAVMPTETWDRAPEDIRVRILRRLLAAFGEGRAEPIPLSRLEAFERRLSSGGPAAGTLAGARAERSGGRITVRRETGRRGLPELHVRPGMRAVWDSRFEVETASSAPRQVVIKALPPETLTRINRERERAGLAQLTAPRAALLTLPSAWDGDRLLGVLHPVIETTAGPIGIAARFIGPDEQD